MDHLLNIFTRKKGFTLIETLVVVAITALLSSFAITYSKISARQVALFVEEQKIGGLILRAKELALTAYIQPTGVCGYGFRINYIQNQYYIFSYVPPGANPCSSILTNGVIPGQITVFSDLTTLNSNLVFPAALPADGLNYVLFLPPNPLTIINANDGNATSSVPGKVYLQTADGLGNVAVTVNLAGLVDY